MNKTFEPLYKRGAKGEIRVWYMEQDDESHRVVAGVKDGNLVESGWSLCSAKNVGKSNATTPVEQATAEILANYQKKKDRGYFTNPDDIDGVKFTKPMLAQAFEKRVDKLSADDILYAQPKLDGIRCIARIDGLWSRTGKPITSCPHIEKALAPLFDANPDLILDGELYNQDLRDDFNTITSLVRKAKHTPETLEKAVRLVQYHIYDVIDADMMFSERSAKVRQLIGENGTGPLRTVETVLAKSLDDIDGYYSKWMEQGYEGQMVRLESAYQVGRRSNSLLKRKDFITDEFPVVDVHEGEGNWAGCVKRFSLLHEDGKTVFGAGVRGTQEELARLLAEKSKPDWATLRFFTRTPDGIPRFPVVIDWGYGKRTD